MPQRSHPKDAEHYRAEANDAAEAARHAAERAAEAAAKAAKAAKEWATPRVEHAYEEAKDWAAPKVEKTYRGAARKATPYVKKAGAKTEEWVDVARGAIVGAAIPAVIAAFERAAAEEIEEPVAARRNNHTLAKVLIPVLIAGAAGAALVIWARRDPGRDEWAGDDDEWDFTGDADFPTRLRRDVNKAVDVTIDVAKRTAATVAEQAGPYVERVKEEAGPYVDRAAAAASAAAAAAAARAKQEASKLREGVVEARTRAAHGLADTFDDAEDVWEDEGGPVEDQATGDVETPAAKKPRAPRKPKP